MKLFTLIFILILCIFTNLHANYYEPNYSLEDYVPLNNNVPDYFKTTKSFNSNLGKNVYLGANSQNNQFIIDSKNQMVEIIVKVDQLVIAGPYYITFDDYLNNSFMTSFYVELDKAKKELFDQKNRKQVKGLIPEIVIKLPPMAMPKGVRKIMGNKAGRLNLSGTQKLSISASQTKKETKAVSESGSNNNFDVSMKQDLNLTLNGTIGEKIKVDVKYNSNQESGILDPNNIKIAYEGEEDEIVQRIDAGNTSLSLSGSRYISLSASSQGLFGIKTLLKIGSLNITAVASKEESQKNTKSYKGNAQSDSTSIHVKSYTNRTHYFMVNPNEVFSLYTQEDADAGLCPPGWVDNAIKTDNGLWIVSNPNILPKENSVKVFLDDDNANNNDIANPGYLFDETGTNLPSDFFFDELLEGVDYRIDYDSGVLILLRSIERRYSIGIAYTQKNNVKVGETENLVGGNIRLKAIKLKNQTIEDYTWNYQARNFYSLNMTNIKNDGFLLEVFSLSSSNEKILTVPDSISHSGYNTYNDFLRLDSDSNGVVNGEDNTVNLSTGYIIFPFLRPFEALNDSYIYTLDPDQIFGDDKYKHYIFVKGKVGRESINLGMMIFPGSVKVKVDGKELKENIDYIVDYDFGLVTFLTPEGKNSDAEINISYENKPMFSVESKTLMGLRADWNITEKIKLGGTFIYHSEKVTDKRPKIGNESRSLMLADIDGELKFSPGFLTTAVDMIPLIKTNSTSNVTLSGEIAMNVPKIYNSSSNTHKYEAWLDDMESILDAYPLGTGRVTWVQASEPYNSFLSKGSVNWFNPNNVYAKEVYHPSTLSTKERNEKVSVLTMKIFPPDIANPNLNTPYWAGLMKYIGNQVDFSEKQYIEFLVKVDSLAVYDNPVKLYFDLGDTSEDFYTDFGGLGKLNTEDGKNGGDVNGQLEYMEDIGLDGLSRKLSNGSINPDSDPNDAFSASEVNHEFPNINGTEGNGRLDTEDLNGNGSLDTLERYYRYSVTLSDTTSVYFQNQFNGWYLYRIPLKNNPNVEKISNVSTEPNLKTVSYVRVWAESESMAKISFINIDIVGNKWSKQAIRERRNSELTDKILTASDISQNNEFISIETADNQKNSHYTAPPSTTEKGDDGELSFEQSLKLQYTNIQSSHISLARQRFRDQYNLLSYNKIRYWVYPEVLHDASYSSDSLLVIFRLGADSLNYYEVSKKVKINPYSTKMLESSWSNIEFSFKDVTYLKTLNESNDTLYVFNNITYRKVKQPTLSNIREIAVGINIPDNQQAFSGILYVNEIRVVDPNQDIGFAARASLDTQFADFSTLKIDYEWKTSDFYSSTTRSTSTNTSVEDKTSLSVSNKYSLDKFFPTPWGLNLPLNLSRTYSIGIPKYRANSDILRSNLTKEDQDREKNISLVRSADLSYNLSKTPNNSLLKYTVKNISLSGSLKDSETLSSTRADSVITWRYSGNYKLDLPKEALGIKLFKNYYYYFFPKYFGNELIFRGENPDRWDYKITADSSYWEVRPQTVSTRQIDTNSEIKYDIFSDLVAGWKLNTKRDLMQRKELYSYNIGEETERTQDYNATYDPSFFDPLIDLSFTSQVQYKEYRKAFKQNAANNTQITIYKYEGNVNRGFKIQTILKNSNLLTSLANMLTPDPNKKYDANTRSSGDKFNDEDKRNEKDDTDDLEKLKLMEMEKRALENKIDEVKPDDNLLVNPSEKSDKKDDEYDDNDPLKKEEEEKKEKIEKDKKEKSDPVDIKKLNQNPLELLASTVGLLAKLQNINFSYENTYGTNFEQLLDRPNYNYQLGIPHALDYADLKQRTYDDVYTASSGFPIFNRLNTDFRYSRTINRRYSASSNQSISTTWPDVRLTLSGFESLIRAEQWLSSSQLNSSFTYTEKLSGNIDWVQPTTELTTITFQPLIGFTGNWVKGISTSLSLNKTTTENITHGTSDIIRESNKNGISGSIKYTFNAQNGFKIPFISKKIIFKNNMESELSVTYENEIATTTGRTKQTDRDSSKLSFTPRASYNFHTNVKGGLTGNYDITKNNKNKESISIFKLDIWVEIQF